MKAVIGCKGGTLLQTAADAFEKNTENGIIRTLRDAQTGFIAK